MCTYIHTPIGADLWKLLKAMTKENVRKKRNQIGCVSMCTFVLVEQCKSTNTDAALAGTCRTVRALSSAKLWSTRLASTKVQTLTQLLVQKHKY